MRKTRLSLELNRIFRSNQKPLTVADILVILKNKKMRPNKTTVYRQLEKMAKNKELDHVHFEKRGLGYEKAREHHHHLICENCEEVEDVVIKNESRILNKLFSRKGFQAKEHHLEVFGLCANCNNK